MKKLTKALAAAALGMAAAASQAQTAQGNFQVTATVQAACAVTATDLVFGPYLATAVKDGTSTITVTCTNGTTYSVGFVGGATNRAMAGPGGSLLYGMYSDAGRNTAFGVAAALGDGSGQGYTVYGRIAAAQYLAAGAYSETVTVQVGY